MKKTIEVATHIFKGPRFENHYLDIDSLQELISYKNLVVETAKELWRKNHPDRERLPKNFEDSLNLKFNELREGCTEVPLKREVEYSDDELQFIPPKDELDDAVDLIAEVSEAAQDDKPIPQAFPKRLLPLFKNYGETLREGESFEQKTVKRPKAVVYSLKTRKKILERSEAEYEDLIDVIGEIRAADLDGLNFTLRLEDGTKVSGKFFPEQEQMITNALREHSTQRLRIKGKAEFTPLDGKLKKIAIVEEMILQASGESPYNPDAKPIWEIAAEIGASVPAKEWERIPKDLSKYFDHYLYGHPKESK